MEKEALRIVFMGTPVFAVPTLQMMIDDGYSVVGVFTQPDRPQGRSQRITAPPVKQLAQTYDIPVFQPVSLSGRDVEEKIQLWDPSLIIVVAYGKILPKTILDYPSFGCVNVHASLLSKYRGASPIQQAILDGEKNTGVTIMYMDQGLDTGDIIIQRSTEIGPEETAGELHDRLSVLGAELLSETLPLIAQDKAPRMLQNNETASYAGILTKEQSLINWKQSANSIFNQIRGLFPWPGSHTFLSGKKLIIHKAALPEDRKFDELPGTVCSVDEKSGIHVCCGDGKLLRLLTVQKEGKRAMPVVDFLKGNPVEVGTRLG
jgi:methionyl-tRNA formyltransferase